MLYLFQVRMISHVFNCTDIFANIDDPLSFRQKSPLSNISHPPARNNIWFLKDLERSLIYKHMSNRKTKNAAARLGMKRR